MEDDKKSTGQPFLSRWSERKREARAAPPTPAPEAVADTPPPPLPPIEELTPESDFSGFMHPKVDENLRRAALKKLFSDPHFNVMDGLDTYVDDYSKSDPLPASMLAGLRQAQNILAWARETKEETAARFAPPPAVEAVVPAEDAAPLPAIEPAAEPITQSTEALPAATNDIPVSSERKS